jgi:molybdenum cofactor synthesis domain-containing protein
VIRAAVLTVSDSRSAGEAEDESGAHLADFAESIGAEVVGRETVADEQAQIEARLRLWADEVDCDLVLTTGGTGFAPRDVTPEATRAVIERESPGIAEAMRLASREHTDLWMVSRGVAGVRGRTLIVNFPGAPKSIAETGPAIAAALRHAVGLLRRDPRD